MGRQRLDVANVNQHVVASRREPKPKRAPVKAAAKKAAAAPAPAPDPEVNDGDDAAHTRLHEPRAGERQPGGD